MSGTEVPSVLRCERCSKPFDKEATLKRHGYYCRSRAVGKTVRARSCLSCVRSKARCDNNRPKCSKCADRDIECTYPANTPKNATARTLVHDDGPSKRQKVATTAVDGISPVEYPQQPNTEANLTFDTAFVPDLDLADFGGDLFDWTDPKLDFPDHTNLQPNNELSFPLEQSFPTQLAFSPMKQSIPPVPTSAIRSLILRPSFKKGGSQRIANLILHTLRSYPLMMLRDNTLPPFIHPHIIYSEKEDDKSCMEPLVNCISLVHMISKNHKGSRKLFWKNVRMECERVFAELKEMDKWARLAAMQALSIYILIRLDEGETEDNNLDFLLLTTVAAIAREIMCSDVGDDITVSTALHDHSTNANWKEWLFLESRQRLAIVYRVVNMLVYFEPSTFCTLQSDLILAPLPSKKQLWESNDSVSWARERVREPHIYYALAASGDVVRLDEGQAFCAGAELLYKPLEVATPLRSPSSFEEWCAGMDGLGGLVMLAASLVG